jgi:cysteine desulfuration protein SufE
MTKGCYEPQDGQPESIYPKKLATIIGLFESLPDEEKRENLIAYSEQARKQEPKQGESFDLEDIRKDEECADTVGVYLQVDDEQRAKFKIALGPAGADAYKSDDVDPL